MRKRIYRTLIILTMTVVLFGVSACGNNASETFPAETESTEEPETKGEEETETTEVDKEESKKEETQKSDTEDKSDTKKESESKEEGRAESTPKTTETKTDNSSKTAESTSTPAPVHEHSYTSSVTQNPTCTSQGVRTYSCGCGASYTESIPSTEHNWKERLNTIEHEAVGEWREILVSEGSGDVYICNYCDNQSGSSEANVNHCASYVGIDNNHARATYTIRSAEPVYSQEWVELSPAWTEEIVIYECSTCGATK